MNTFIKLPPVWMFFTSLSFWLVSCGETAETTKPEVRSMTESVYASVTIRPEKDYLAFSKVQGVLDELLVAVGDTVKAGQMLAHIRSDDAALDVLNAVENYDLAKSHYSGEATLLASIEDELFMNQQQLTNDSINYFRQRRLFDQNIGSAVEMETRKLRYDQAVVQRGLLQKKWRQQKKQLETNYNQASNAVKLAKNRSNDYFIRAEMNGVVYQSNKEVGETVGPQEPLFEIGAISGYIIHMRIDEIDIVRVEKGQQVIITLEAYPNQVFEAEIAKINPKKDDRTQTFAVEARFTKAPSKLYAGLTGEANIVIAIKENVLTIPNAYLINGNAVQTNDSLRTLEIGLSNFQYTEILSGLDAQTEILKPVVE